MIKFGQYELIEKKDLDTLKNLFKDKDDNEDLFDKFLKELK